MVMRSFLYRYHWEFHYLIVQCQEVVVEPEGSQAGCVQLEFERSAIQWDIAIGRSCVHLERRPDFIRRRVSFSVTRATAISGLTYRDRAE